MKSMFPQFRIVALLLLVRVAFAAQPDSTAVPGERPVSLEQARFRARTMIERPELAAYRGWIKFLVFEAENAAVRMGTNRAAVNEKTTRLVEWLERIESNPAVLTTLRGVQEWAYESPADDSGQPFRLNIPTDYDPTRPAPLSVYMHGYSGNHLEHSTGMKSHGEFFEMAVLGRGRGVGYFGLAEADVLQAIDYVQTHWKVDPDRIHIKGGSMGGGATLRLGSRYPHRFASGQPTCGFGVDLPVANLLTFPIYATHSDDDWTVPVLLSRGPLARLRQLGGEAIFDETNGFGHAVWDYAAGNERGDAWANRQKRPDSRTVRRLDFTALDGDAARDWWVEIVEWGLEPRPARFIVRAATDNTLYAELLNISRLRLSLKDSPFDRSQALHVSVAGAVPFEIPAPLPESIVVAANRGTWQVDRDAAPAGVRLHTPGGPLLLYDGSPLLIVYGTHGNAALCEAMRLAAEAASKSANPGWAGGGPAGSDGVPHSQNLYGHLKVKADREVSDADMQRCHLILIGDAIQNSVVGQLAYALPLQLAQGQITCSDGTAFVGTHRVLGLVHYNPLAAQRLIFWVAAEDPAGYGLENSIVQNAARRFIGADLLIMDAVQPLLVASRSFDSRWHWNTERATSPLLSASLLSHESLAVGMAEAIRLAAGADFAVAAPLGPAHTDAFVSGTTRLADLLPIYYHEPIGLFDVSGAELLDMDRSLQGSGGEPSIRFQPSLGKILPHRTYRVAIAAGQVSPFASLTKAGPRSFRVTDLQAAEAFQRFLQTQD
jgi:hypothetical protein